MITCIAMGNFEPHLKESGVLVWSRVIICRLQRTLICWKAVQISTLLDVDECCINGCTRLLIVYCYMPNFLAQLFYLGWKTIYVSRTILTLVTLKNGR